MRNNQKRKLATHLRCTTNLRDYEIKRLTENAFPEE